MADRKWYISEWHNISGSAVPIEMDGVLYQDIASIIKTIMNHQCVKDYQDRLDTLYKHIVDYNNPHKLTTSQFETQVIEYFYEVWIREGYDGTLDYFKELIYRYIKIGTYDDLVEGESLELATRVKDVANYIRAHDEEEIKAHAIILNNIIPGKPPRTQPMLSIFRYLGVPYDIQQLYNSKNDIHSGIILPGLEKFMIDNYSIAVNCKYENNNNVAIIADKNNLNVWTVRLDKTNKRIVLNHSYADVSKLNFFGFTGQVLNPMGEDIFYSNLTKIAKIEDLYILNISDLVKNHPNMTYITFIIVFEGYKIRMYAEPCYVTHDVKGITRMVGDIKMLSEYRGPEVPYLAFTGLTTMNSKLRSIEFYREAFIGDTLNFAFNSYR